MSFSGLRWDPTTNNNKGSWVCKFIPLKEHLSQKKRNQYTTKPTGYPGNMHSPNPNTNLRKIWRPKDLSLPLNHWKEYLEELRAQDEVKEVKESQRAWLKKVDDQEVEVEVEVEEGKSSSQGSEEAGAGRLDAKKARQLRATRRRRSSSDS
jgi:hypothetical protein